MGPPLPLPHRFRVWEERGRGRGRARMFPPPALSVSHRDTLCPCPVGTPPPLVCPSLRQPTPRPSSSDTSPWTRTVKQEHIHGGNVELQGFEQPFLLFLLLCSAFILQTSDYHNVMRLIQCSYNEQSTEEMWWELFKLLLIQSPQWNSPVLSPFFTTDFGMRGHDTCMLRTPSKYFLSFLLRIYFS